MSDIELKVTVRDHWESEKRWATFGIDKSEGTITIGISAPENRMYIDLDPQQTSEAVLLCIEALGMKG